MWQVWGIGEVHTGFWGRNMGKRDHLEGLGVDVMKILKLIFKKYNAMGWTGLIMLKIGRDIELFCVR